MTLVKRLALGGLVFVALLAAAVFLAPVLFGDRIREEVTKQIDRYVDADVAYGDVELTLLRDFPRLSLVLDDLAVEGRGAFDTVRLAAVGELAVAVDFWSAVGDGPIGIRSVELVRPDLHVVTLADGRTNTDILRNLGEAADTAAATPAGGSTAIELDRYAVVDGELTYDDRAAGLYVHVADLDHEGSGDFTATRFALDTRTTVGALDLVSAGIPYARAASVAYDAELLVDTEAETLTLADNDLTFNELHLAAEGVVGLPQEDGSVAVDVSFAAPQQDFRALWSAVPATFTRDLTGLKTSGRFALTGEVEGTYAPEPASLPAFVVDLAVDDASVQYPDLPRAITALDVRVGARSAGADLADLLVDVERFAFRLGANPFAGSLRIRDSVTDPAFDLDVEGRLDLADVAQAIPLEGVDELAGLIALDVEARGTASGAQRDLRSIRAEGLASFTDVVYVAEGTPRIEVADGKARFRGSEMVLEPTRVRAGSSDVTVEGTLTDVFALATETGTLGGNFAARAGRLDANEWLAPAEAPAPVTDAEIPADAGVATRPFDRFDVAFDLSADELLYDVYALTDVVARGDVTADDLTLATARADIAGSDLALEGALSNLFGFAFDGGELTGAMRLRSDRLDLLALSEAGVDSGAQPAQATAPAAEAGYLALPADMSIRVAAAVGELVYDGIVVDDVTGVVAIANQSAVVENGRGKVIGGTMRIDGGYQYRGEETPPTFDLKYDIANASFAEAFAQLNTVQRLAPIAQYITGTFNTNLVMSAPLGRDMLPVIRDLDADGFVNTLDATIQKFGPLATAADKLGLEAFETIELKNTKNWFTVEDGTVAVRPFEVSWRGIDATIGGTHGLDQAMDYEIVALVPRDLLGDNAVGAAANKGLDFLGSQAARLGIDLAVGEFVRVGVNLTGSIDDPNVGIKLLGTEGAGGRGAGAGAVARDLARQARDSLEREAQARLDAAKAEAEQRARAVADSVRAAAETRARAAAEEAKERAEAEAKRAAERAAARAGEEAKAAAEKAADQLGEDAKDKAKDAVRGLFGRKKDPDRG